jgi:hypothetical protein
MPARHTGGLQGAMLVRKGKLPAGIARPRAGGSAAACACACAGTVLPAHSAGSLLPLYDPVFAESSGHSPRTRRAEQIPGRQDREAQGCRKEADIRFGWAQPGTAGRLSDVFSLLVDSTPNAQRRRPQPFPRAPSLSSRGLGRWMLGVRRLRRRHSQRSNRNRPTTENSTRVACSTQASPAASGTSASIPATSP